MRKWLMPDRADPRNVEVPEYPVTIGDYGMVVHIGLTRHYQPDALAIQIKRDDMVHLVLDRKDAERLYDILGELLERVPPVYR